MAKKSELHWSVERRLVKIGHSRGIIIPKMVREALGWSDDAVLFMFWGTTGLVFTQRKSEVERWKKMLNE